MSEKEKQAKLGETEEGVKPATPPAPAPASPEEKVSHVTRLVVGKGRTSRPGEAEEWIKEYFELEAAIIDDREIEVAKSTMEGIILGWLTAARPLGTTPITAAPITEGAIREEAFNVLQWERQTGARIGEYEIADKSNSLPDKWAHAHAVLRQNNATISNRYHGPGYLHGYWLYGENRIYRKLLGKKPPKAGADLENVKAKFPSDLKKLLIFGQEGDFIVIKPREYLGSETFAKIASIVREAGGGYVSAGKASRFRIKK